MSKLESQGNDEIPKLKLEIWRSKKGPKENHLYWELYVEIYLNKDDRIKVSREMTNK